MILWFFFIVVFSYLLFFSPTYSIIYTQIVTSKRSYDKLPQLINSLRVEVGFKYKDAIICIQLWHCEHTYFEIKIVFVVFKYYFVSIYIFQLSWTLQLTTVSYTKNDYELYFICLLLYYFNLDSQYTRVLCLLSFKLFS